MFKFFKKFSFKSSTYWENRYKAGGNSGAGSYDKFAEFKAAVLNKVIQDYVIKSVIEFGCGDGNQLSMLNIPEYIGLDVSPTIIEHCKKKFEGDPTKRFFAYDEKSFKDNRNTFRAEAAMSIDVIFHVVEWNVFETYLKNVFESGSRLVIIFGADIDLPPQNSHELYRRFTPYIAEKFPEWKLVNTVKNIYPPKHDHDDDGSNADFYFYTKTGQ